MGLSRKGRRGRVYLDWNGSAPVRDEAMRAARDAMEVLGNPSSLHAEGRQARALLDEARESVAALMGCSTREVIFTSGGSEANRLAVEGLARAAVATGGGSFVSHKSLHASALRPLELLEGQGFTAHWMAVDGEGRIKPFRGKTETAGAGFCVSEVANHETGCIQFVEELAVACGKVNVPLHLDAVQAWGKIPFSLGGQEVATASLSGHKLGAPKGVGALYVHRDAPVDLPLLGGPQERERRAGTENLPGIAGLGAACRRILENGGGERRRMADLTGRLLHGIRERWPRVRLNGPEEPLHRLPNTVNVSFNELEAELLVQALDLEGVAVSAGAACTSGAVGGSAVLEAMGYDPVRARTGLRISLGAENTPAGIDFFLTALERVLDRFDSLRDAGAQP